MPMEHLQLLLECRDSKMWRIFVLEPFPLSYVYRARDKVKETWEVDTKHDKIAQAFTHSNIEFFKLLENYLH
jgi:hypothetical protein